MARHAGLLTVSLTLLLGGILFYALAVAGAFFEKPTPPTDIGLYAVTVCLVGLGVGGLLLRSAKIGDEAAAE